MIPKYSMQEGLKSMVEWYGIRRKVWRIVSIKE
jgi:hypothetical protein